MRRILSNLSHWWSTLWRSMLNQYKQILHDQGVMMFFLALPLLYPITYTLIYNPEVVTDLPMAIVDHSRTSQSR